MIYTELTRKASQIMFNAHKGDLDKGGYPYVMHPIHLAEQMTTEAATCVALLHDVVEDHEDTYDFEQLQADFPEEITDALRLLTHDESEPYMPYVKRLAKNTIAAEVKMADLAHNMNADRVGGRPYWKYPAYLEAFEYLKEHSDAPAPDSVQIVNVPAGSRALKGVSVEIPGTGKNVLQIKCRKGLLLCGLFSPEKIGSIDFPACVFAAPEFRDMLANKPLFVSAKARAMGVTEDMCGEQIAEIFDK
ncbi:MAG: hypothetical protein MJ161_06860 [Clostridia bacterium]|nr:hypothetical protein [Clostridia bacterium]